MKITALKSQRRAAERVNVHVDGEFRFGLARELVAAHGLRVGTELTPAQLRELENEDLGWKAREAALSLLSHRPRTARELRQRLARKGFPEDVVAACVERLADAGLVDDAAFSESFVRDRVRFRPRGRRRLVQELRSRGVAPDAAEAAVSDVLADQDVSEVELARAAAAKWSARPGEDPVRARRRLYGFLGRRGFGMDAIRTVLDEIQPG